MNNRGQMLMIAGLLMTLTLLTISISISHSANLGRYQGERHDPAPLLTMLDAHLPPALDAELDGGATAETAFAAASELLQLARRELVDHRLVFADIE